MDFRQKLTILTNIIYDIVLMTQCKINLTYHKLEICRDRRDRRSCKICDSCVNFPEKQSNFSHNLRRTTRFTHTKYDFALKLSKFYTLS